MRLINNLSPRNLLTAYVQIAIIIANYISLYLHQLHPDVLYTNLVKCTKYTKVHLDRTHNRIMKALWKSCKIMRFEVWMYVSESAWLLIMMSLVRAQLGEPKTRYNSIGVDDAEAPPVPIPNTEVKLCGAEDSALATRCENREMLTQGESQTFLHSSVGRAHDC